MRRSNSSDSEGELNKSLLENTETKRNDYSSKADEKKDPSKARQCGMLFTVLCLQFLSLCADTSIFPFFPAIAKVKGLTTTQMGFVFSCYELSRCIFSPVFGSLVSIHN